MKVFRVLAIASDDLFPSSKVQELKQGLNLILYFTQVCLFRQIFLTQITSDLL
ncbi:hypothetical protein Scep_019981 [Stephania cephalantha]|uniref:Uncharacterized protein n=1 Tax=Stephania cephalantha TaxID=152367 RepID=A0AAP0NLY8_9MAGN